MDQIAFGFVRVTRFTAFTQPLAINDLVDVVTVADHCPFFINRAFDQTRYPSGFWHLRSPVTEAGFPLHCLSSGLTAANARGGAQIRVD
jgi:hypothetical protein